METKAPREGGNITILVLGDEGVGKSSLVSTFISRHFSELVPPVITRVRIPPDAQLANCTSTIIDTQEGDAVLSDALSLSGARLGSRSSLASISADSISSCDKKGAGGEQLGGAKRPPAATLLAAASPYRNVDAIVLVYDLDRSETFERLSSHWLPLIDKCYDGEMPVVIAGNKMDMQSSSVATSSSVDNEQSAWSRQEIISLLQKFTFVRQSIKCSAKNLLNIDEVFRKAQQAVLYPINPLYDLSTGRLTSTCTRALSRIFRIFDEDNDGLLSDEELSVFQRTVWGVTLMQRDVSSWKKVVVEHNSFCQRDADTVLRDGKFTLRGFLVIFDVFISQNRLEVPWKVFRSFGYNDALDLVVPLGMSESDDFADIIPSEWKLSINEMTFVAKLFDRYDSNKDGVLTSDEIRSIFSVLPDPLPPWSERGKDLFDSCPSVPRFESEGTSPSSSILGVPFDASLEMSPLPTSAQESSPDSPSMLSASGITISSSPLPSVDASKDTTPPSNALGSRPISFLTWMNHWHMMCTISPSACRIELYRLGYIYNLLPKDHGHKSASSRRKQTKPTTLSASIKVPQILVRALVVGSKESDSAVLIRKLHGETYGSSNLLEYPETSCSVSKMLLCKHNRGSQEGKTETAVHLILTHVPVDTSKDHQEKLASLLEEGVYDAAFLVYNTQRSFDMVKQFEARFMNDKMPRIFVCTASEQLSQAVDHCKEMKLESPRIVDLDKPQLDSSFTEYLISFTQRPRRRAFKRTKLLWLGGLVTVGITVVIGLTICRKKKNGSENGWFKCLLDLVSS